MDSTEWIPHTTKSGKILYYINPATGECKWQRQLNKVQCTVFVTSLCALFPSSMKKTYTYMSSSSCVGDVVALINKWLACWTPNSAVRVQVLTEVIVCSWARY